jgi:hypothetical protein
MRTYLLMLPRLRQSFDFVLAPVFLEIAQHVVDLQHFAVVRGPQQFIILLIRCLKENVEQRTADLAN